MAKHTKKASNVKSIFIAVVAVLLAVALVVASCLTTGYLITGTANVLKWQKITQPAPGVGGETGGDVEGVGNNMIIAPGEEYGISLTSALIAPNSYADYGISAQAETAYEFTATAYDETGTSNGVPQDMEGSASWKNSSSTWASGKNVEQFVTVTKTGDNQFRVSCLQAFGEPVILTIKSAHSTASATKQFDYVKRVSDVRIVPSATLVFGGSTGMTPEITYGVGTVVGEVYVDYVRGEFSSAFGQAFQTNSYYTYFSQQCNNSSIDWDWDTTLYQKSVSTSAIENNKTYDSWLVLGEPDMFLASGMSSENVTLLGKATNYFQYLSYALQYALNQLGNNKQFTIDNGWHYTYGGEEYSKGNTNSGTFALTIMAGNPLPNITSVTISGQDSYVF